MAKLPANVDIFVDASRAYFGDAQSVIARTTLAPFFHRNGGHPWDSGRAKLPVLKMLSEIHKVELPPQEKMAAREKGQFVVKKIGAEFMNIYKKNYPLSAISAVTKPW